MNENERKQKVDEIKKLLIEVVQNGDAAFFLIDGQCGVVAKGVPHDIAMAATFSLQSMLFGLAKNNLHNATKMTEILVTGLAAALTIAHKDAGTSTEEYASIMEGLESKLHDVDLMLKACDAAEEVKRTSEKNSNENSQGANNFFADIMKNLLKL